MASPRSGLGKYHRRPARRRCPIPFGVVSAYHTSFTSRLHHITEGLCCRDAKEVGMKRTEGSGSSSLTFLLCLATAIFEGADNVSLGLAAPRVAKELGLHASQMGLALSASLIGLMLGSFLGGRLADRMGRKRVLIMSMATLGAFSLATTVAREFGALLLLRFIVGLGIGGAFPILIAMASEASSHGRRAAAIGLVYSGNPLGAALLSLLVSLLGDTVNWRAIFYVGGFGPLLLVPV